MIARYASAVVTLGGILALLSGLTHWLGIAPGFLSMHMLLGYLTVAFSAGGSSPVAALAIVVGAFTIYLGMNQTVLLPGENHWLIQLGHMVLGILTIGVGHMAAARQRHGAAV
jgi:hypothetical protein